MIDGGRTLAGRLERYRAATSGLAIRTAVAERADDLAIRAGA